MNQQEYDKLKAKNKTQFKLGCVVGHEQEIAELKEACPNAKLLDFYYSEHLGVWIVLSENEEFNENEFETKADLQLAIAQQSGTVNIKLRIIDSFRDGGTLACVEPGNEKINYYIDRRIGTLTKDKLFDKYPGDEGANMLYMDYTLISE